MNNSAQFAEFSFNSIQQRKPHHVAWGAFKAGMQFLQQNAGRSPGNSETIAISNLQLLHRSLLKESSYAHSIKEAQMKISANCLPRSCCIFNEKGLRADLLSLDTGMTIQMKSPQDSCAMYLAITGKPSIQTQNEQQPNEMLSTNKHWWHINHKRGHEKSLKNGDAVILSSGRKGKQILTADKKTCLLLRIQLPNR